MLVTLIPFLVAFFIFSADFIIVNGETFEEKCAKQTSYAVLSDAKSLTTNLFYDASTDLETDLGFIWAMCLARQTFTTEKFNFYVGARVKTGNNGIECHHEKESDKDCKDNIEHACASKLIPKQFADLVCCTNEKKTARQCLYEIDAKKATEFDQCVQFKHPDIKPDQVLLLNAKAAKKAIPEGHNFPVLTFNGKNADKCASYMFYQDPIKVVCILLVNCS